MDVTTDRPQASELPDEQDEQVGGEKGFWKIAALILGVVALGLFAVVAYDLVSEDEAAVPPDVQQVLDDYIAAWETQDVDAFRAVVADDFYLTEEYFAADGERWVIEGDADMAARGIAKYDYTVEHVGTPIVTGDGPWFVSMSENWIEGLLRSEGTASYAIIDDDGTLRISEHYWAGLRVEGY